MRDSTKPFSTKPFYTNLLVTKPLKHFGLMLAALGTVLAFGDPAEAANPAELNFGLFGPK